MLKVKQFTFNHFMENCYVLYDEDTHQCAIVDPGMEAPMEEAQLYQFMDSRQLTPQRVLLTHAHPDHLAGLWQTCQRYRLPASLHADSLPLLAQAHTYGSAMGFGSIQPMGELSTSLMADGDTLALATSTIEARYVPGHCPGSLCYVLEEEKMVLTGDALFRGSIGRTDLPGGDYDQLIAHLHSRIMVLPSDYEVLPGHGELSTIGEETQYNPFLGGL